MDAGLLDVVTCYFNPIRWKTRLELAKQHLQHLVDSGVRVTLVECQTGDRPFELADFPNIRHVPVRSKTLVWNKESLLRIGMQRLDPDWEYVAWTDADIKFRKPDWAEQTVHALQIYDIVQPWSDAYDLGPDDSHMTVYKSFGHQYWHGHSVVYGIDPGQSNFEKRVHGLAVQHPQNRLKLVDKPVEPQHVRSFGTAALEMLAGRKHKKKHHGDGSGGHDTPCDCDCCCCCCSYCPPCPPPYYGAGGTVDNGPQMARMARGAGRRPWWKSEGGPHEYPHTGYAWAARRSAIEGVGGLFELAAMGASDYHMALALIGYAEKSLPASVSDSYRKHLLEWQERALREINYNVGYVQGTIEHSFHGRKADRRYIDRWQIILEHGFDPDTDIMKNSAGVIELTCRKPKLRHDLDVYLRQRNEDANTV